MLNSSKTISKIKRGRKRIGIEACLSWELDLDNKKSAILKFFSIVMQTRQASGTRCAKL